MTDSSHAMDTARTTVAAPSARTVLVRLGLALFLMAGGAGLMHWQVANRPTPTAAEIVTPPTFVEVKAATQTPHTMTLTGYGTVRSAKTVMVKPQVSGQVIRTHPQLEKGVVLQPGEVLFELDPRDYRLRRDMSLSDKARLTAEIAQLQEEMAYSENLLSLRREAAKLSQKELQRVKNLLANEGVGTASEVDRAQQAAIRDTEQVTQLAKTLSALPHRITSLEAQVRRINAQIASDELQIARCTVKTTFLARVESVGIEQDDYLQAGMVALTLTDDSLREIPVALDAADVTQWLKFDAAVDKANWFGQPEPVNATVNWVEDDSVQYIGRFARLEDFDVKTRTVTAVVTLPVSADAAKPYPLVTGMFCAVTIPGKELPRIFLVPRTAIGEDNDVLIVDAENKLRSRPVRVIRRHGDHVLVDEGLAPGDRVIVTRPPAPVDGMAVEIRQANAKNGASESAP